MRHPRAPRAHRPPRRPAALVAPLLLSSLLACSSGAGISLVVDGRDLPLRGGLIRPEGADTPYLAAALVETGFGAAVKHVAAGDLAVVCRGTICVPLRIEAGGKAIRVGRGLFVEASALARALSYELQWLPDRRLLSFRSMPREAAGPAAAALPAGLEPSEQAGRLVAGLPALDFNLPRLDGPGTVPLSSFRGQRVLVHCWASWDRCREHLRAWQAFHDKHKDRNFTLLGVAMEVQGAAAASPYVRRAGVTFPMLVDPENRLGEAYGMTTIPTTFLVDELGLVRAVGRGPDRAFLDGVEAILAEPSGPTAAVLAAGSVPGPASAAALTSAPPALTDPAATGAAGSREPEPQRTAADPVAEAHRLLAAGDRSGAAAYLRRALEGEPRNRILRQQILAIEHPDRFYPGPIDTAWLERRIREEPGERR
jgi:peroxiredoxin